MVTGGPASPPSIGGAEGTGCNYPGTRVREAGPPIRRYLEALQTLSPDPGRRVYDVEAYDDKTSCGAAGGSRKGRSRRSSPPTHPGATARRKRGVFPSGFPPHVEDFGPSHRSVIIALTAGGQHRQPRHNRGSQPPGGGRRSHEISKGVLVGITNTGRGSPQWGCVERSLGLYPSDFNLTERINREHRQDRPDRHC